MVPVEAVALLRLLVGVLLCEDLHKVVPPRNPVCIGTRIPEAARWEMLVLSRILDPRVRGWRRIISGRATVVSVEEGPSTEEIRRGAECFKR